MYPSHWSRDHRHHHQEHQHRTTHRSPTPDRDRLLRERKRRYDEEDDRPSHRGKSLPITTFPSPKSYICIRAPG